MKRKGDYQKHAVDEDRLLRIPREHTIYAQMAARQSQQQRIRNADPVGTVVCVRVPEMKQAWCLAASSTEATAKDLTAYYGSRWGIRRGVPERRGRRSGMG